MVFFGTSDGVMIVVTSSLATAILVIVTVLHRLYWSSLAKVPGPKLAAITSWYEIYYDVFKEGTYIWKIKEMHEQYGPIVRVNPWEVQVSDSAFYDEIYTSSASRRDKDPTFAHSFNVTTGDEAAFWTAPHALHLLRRSALNPYFSKRKIADAQDVVKLQVVRLCERLQALAGAGDVVNLSDAFFATMTDIATNFCSGESWGLLKFDDFNAPYHAATMDIVRQAKLRKHFPIVQRLMTLIPMGAIAKLNPTIAFHMAMDKRVEDQVKNILQERKDGNPTDNVDSAKTLFHAAAASEALPEAQKTVERLKCEGMVIVGAGGATSARAISVAIFHIISLPDIQQTLREELNPIVGTLSSNQLPLLRSLEQLPYLTACIKESLRLSCGFVARSARIAPDETLQYHWYSIPAGTPISTSSWFVHYNPDIFPDPSAFRPDRWLEAGASQGTTYDAEAAAAIRVRNRNFVPFGRGARACQGMNLAWAEMYLTLCALLTRFDIQLFNTTLEDVEVRHDWGFAQSRIGSKGVRVRLRLRD